MYERRQSFCEFGAKRRQSTLVPVVIATLHVHPDKLDANLRECGEDLYKKDGECTACPDLAERLPVVLSLFAVAAGLLVLFLLQ